jgi:Amidase
LAFTLDHAGPMAWTAEDCVILLQAMAGHDPSDMLSGPVGRTTEAYGVSYDAFLLNALDHTGGGERDLCHAPAGVIAGLSVGTGISIERLLDMTSQRAMARLGFRGRGN